MYYYFVYPLNTVLSCRASCAVVPILETLHAVPPMSFGFKRLSVRLQQCSCDMEIRIQMVAMYMILLNHVPSIPLVSR